MLKSVFVSMFVFAMGCHADTTVQNADGEGVSSASPIDANVNSQITDPVAQSISPASNVTCTDGATPVDGVCTQTVTVTVGGQSTASGSTTTETTTVTH